MTTISTTPTALEAIPLEHAEDEEVRARLDRDGAVLISDVIPAAECRRLQQAIRRYAEDPQATETGGNPQVLPRAFEFLPEMLQVLSDPRILRWARVMLGEHVRVMDQRILDNSPGRAIDGFHVDRDLLFPCTQQQPRHPAEARMPIFWGQVRLYLTGAHRLEDGPTQYVLGSHYAGRQPNDRTAPTFEGRGVSNVFCDPGAIVIHNGQVWHRGTPNQHGRRCLINNVYCRPFFAHDMLGRERHAALPQHLLDNQDPSVREIFGIDQRNACEGRQHDPKEAYGR